VAALEILPAVAAMAIKLVPLLVLIAAVLE